MSLTDTLEHLMSDAPLRRALLYNLSRLEPDELGHLTDIWAAVPDARRRSLVRELVEIAEASFEVDFDDIFRWGLRDSDPEVRAASIEGLWENETLDLMHELVHMLEEDESALVRAAAATSLGRYILLSELGKLAPERSQAAYQSLYQTYTCRDNDLHVRRRALESLSYINTPEISALLQEAYEHPEEKMRISAVFGMGRSADTRWLRIVMGELFSVNPEMRYEAARACGEMEAREAVSRLAELVDDPDREVQEAALWALGQIGGDQARQILEQCSVDEDEVMRSAARAALQELAFMEDELDFLLFALDQDDTDLDW